MALKIRLRRMGRKNAPTYRIVVAESSMPRDGRIVESLGHYNPRTDPLTLVVDRPRALHWIARGAVPTDTAGALLKRAGVFRPESEWALVDAAVTAVASAKSSARKAATKVKAAAGKVVDVVEDAVDEVREVAGNAVEAAVDVAEDVAEAVGDAAEDAADAVKSRRKGKAAEAESKATPEAESEAIPEGTAETAPEAEAAPVAEAEAEPAAEVEDAPAKPVAATE